MTTLEVRDEYVYNRSDAPPTLNANEKEDLQTEVNNIMANQQIQKRHFKRERSSITISEDCGVSRNEPITLQEKTVGTQNSEQNPKRSHR